MYTDMRQAIDRAAPVAFLGRDKAPREGQVLRRLFHHPYDTPTLNQVFQPRALAVGAVAMVDENAHDRRRCGYRLLGFEQDAAVLRERSMPGQPAKQHAEVDALRRGLVRSDPDRSEADIVGVFE